MTRDVRQRDGLQPADQKFLSIIETHGWHVTRVFNRGGDTGPEFAYSTGLFHSYGHPEVIVTGLELEMMHRIINNVGTGIRNGNRYIAGQEYSDILENYGCHFREVKEIYFRDYVGWSIWFYRKDPFPMLQCFWPDREGHYPWEAECSEGVAAAQPLLFK